MNKQKISAIAEKQRSFFLTQKTRPAEFRKRALKRLYRGIKRNEDAIGRALKQDLNKSESEAYMAEIGMVLDELKFMLNHMDGWMSRKPVKTPPSQLYSKSFTVYEPYGSVLIMAPWNYPFMLCMEPLVDALAAGNCAVVKPSAYAPASSAVIRKIIEEAFPFCYVAVVEGGREENSLLLEQRFDYIFFTGSVEVGKIVMEKAAHTLTPVTLELGGKSPCIVDETADLKMAAKRIVFGKLLNSGQTCVAPDYILVQKRIKEPLVQLLKKEIHNMLGKEPLENPNYPKIINEKHYERILKLIQDAQVTEGGYGRRETLQIAPTVVENITLDSPIMQEEIFGPVLPVISYEKKEEALTIIRHFEKPLALYLFTRNQKMEQYILDNVSFGGGCINDTIVHLATSHMGFGGVGASGMGSYHGRAGFETFSHRKSILKKAGWPDLPMRYHPYKEWKKKMIKLFLN